jgi:hypothetical protein
MNDGMWGLFLVVMFFTTLLQLPDQPPATVGVI